ncbi:MAG TPA: SDR family oxidoreductase [Candidatus Acidoferrales bacterium]|nr:SDR family oxidoreductase [Candidatus Acidoferrales bacterium]
MEARIDGKQTTVLVTGGTDGLGRATALLFASEGYRVFAAGRNPQKRTTLEQIAKEKKLPLETLELDVTSDESAARVIGEITNRAGPVDVLVNNAGIAIAAAMEEITIEDLRKQFETNVFSMVRMSQRVLPGMREKGRGYIINMSSIAGKTSNPLMGPYSGSKHAVEAISDAMRMELASFGIHVVMIEPGFIPTNIGQASADASSRYTENAAASPYARAYLGFMKLWRKIMANAKSTPEDCAQVILRAVQSPSPRARYLVTREAKITAAMRWLLSDRQLDKMTLRMMGLDQPASKMPDVATVRAQIAEMIRPRTR